MLSEHQVCEMKYILEEIFYFLHNINNYSFYKWDPLLLIFEVLTFSSFVEFNPIKKYNENNL